MCVNGLKKGDVYNFKVGICWILTLLSSKVVIVMTKGSNPTSFRGGGGFLVKSAEDKPHCGGQTQQMDFQRILCKGGKNLIF